MYQDASLRFIGEVERVTEQETTIRIFPEFCPGLEGIGDHSHLIVLYWAHLRDGKEERSVLKVVPKRHSLNREVGVFSTRGPTRPNPILLCVVELVEAKECKVRVRGLDAFEGSLVVDIKPYAPRADTVPNARVPEWMEHGPPT